MPCVQKQGSIGTHFFATHKANVPNRQRDIIFYVITYFRYNNM